MHKNNVSRAPHNPESKLTQPPETDQSPPPAAPRPSPWTPGRVFALAFVLLLAAGGLATSAHPVDDAYISFRFADNLMHGRGLVFNAGERIEGYTSFGWLLVSAPFTSLGKDWAPRAAVLFDLLAWAGVVALIWRRMRREIGDARPAGLEWFVLLNLSLCLPAVMWSWSGMETAPFALAWVAAWSAHLDERETDAWPWRSALLTFAAGLLHPEGVLIGVVLGLGWLAPLAARRVRRAAAYWAIAWGAFGLYWLWRWRYFGEPMPNTFNVKVGAGGGSLLGSGLSYLWLGALSAVTPIAMLVAGLVRRKRWRDQPRWLWTALGLVAVLAVYVVRVGGDYFPFQRFLLPALPFCALALWRFWRDGRPPAARAFAWVGAAAATGAIALWSCAVPNMQIVWQNIFQAVVPQFADAGRAAAVKIPADVTIATVPIGAFGYYSDRRLLDLLGLADAHIAHLPTPTGERNVGHEKYDYDYVFARQPEIIMQLPALFSDDADGRQTWLRKTTINRYEYDIYRHPELRANYRLAFLPVTTRPAPAGRATNLGVYAFLRTDQIARADFREWRPLPPDVADFPFEKQAEYVEANRKFLGHRRLGMWKFSGPETER
jgi:hypothetical protein